MRKKNVYSDNETLEEILEKYSHLGWESNLIINNCKDKILNLTKIHAYEIRICNMDMLILDGESLWTSIFGFENINRLVFFSGFDHYKFGFKNINQIEYTCIPPVCLELINIDFIYPHYIGFRSEMENIKITYDDSKNYNHKGLIKFLQRLKYIKIKNLTLNVFPDTELNEYLPRMVSNLDITGSKVLHKQLLKEIVGSVIKNKTNQHIIDFEI